VARLIYGILMSVDGYVADDEGNFGWARPDEEVHSFVNDLERPLGTHLYGRRMYETMVYWETAGDEIPHIQDYAGIWQSTDKVVYSRTLEEPTTSRTRIEREFDADAVRRLKAEADQDLSVGGPELAAQAIAAGLVDDYHLFVMPAVVGAGKRALPEARLDLELVDTRRFPNGTVYLRYGVRST